MDKKFIIGKEYTARSFSPIQKEKKEVVKHIRENEKLKIIEIDEAANELKILNLSLDNENAWVWLSESEFKRVIRMK